MVRAGAACDQAQSQSGTIPLLLGFLVPSTALSANKRSPAVHVCEEKFELEGYQEPVSLLIHARFSTTTVAQELQSWPAANASAAQTAADNDSCSRCIARDATGDASLPALQGSLWVPYPASRREQHGPTRFQIASVTSSSVSPVTWIDRA